MSTPDFISAAQIAVPQLASPAVAGNVVSTAVSAGRSLLSDVASFPNIGLAMRFRVEVDGYDLGDWTSCEGLRVEFKYEAIRSGGDYLTSHILPQAVSYDPVTLKRAVERESSQTVQRWLSRVVTAWQQGGEIRGTNVTITLLDVFNLVEAPAAQWVLANAFPKSWSGPSMNAKTNDIAIETLVLEHDGFLEGLS